MKKNLLQYNILIIILLNLLIQGYTPLLNAQSEYTISGRICNANTKESLVGALISLKDTHQKIVKGIASDRDGQFSIKIKSDTYIIEISYLGFELYSDKINLKNNINQTYKLKPNTILEEVIISSEKADQNVTGSEVGRINLDIKSIKKLPSMFGETDLLKSIQLLPGIKSSDDSGGGFYVRGGGSDQNLILLDNAPIYNAGHLFGFFSIFNADAISSMDVYKSGMPAYYGGRLASIIDITQKEGNLKKYEIEGGLGIIFSRLCVQGPIVKDKVSFLISGRTTYADLIIQPFLKDDSPIKGSRLYFYDINAKITTVINDKNRLYLSGFFGQDGYTFKSESGSLKAKFAWDNGMATAKWNYLISPQLSLNTSFIFSNYNFLTNLSQSVYSFKMTSGVRDYSVKSEAIYMPTKIPHVFKFGLQYIYHIFSPGSYNANAGEAALDLGKTQKYRANDLAIYANDEFDLGKAIKINLGLRYTYFAHIGAFTRYVCDSITTQIIDSTVYKSGERIQEYNHLEPRFSIRFLVSPTTSIKASFTMNYQYIHQIAMAAISLPADTWMPSTSLIKPQYGTQYTLGVFKNWKDNMFETYIDLYYKDLKNLVEYQESSSSTLDFNNNTDYYYTYGSGKCYGVEFYIKKSKGRFTGFIGYTLSYAIRHFPELNQGQDFYAKYDRRHDISISLSYEFIRQKLSLSTVWVFSSGNHLTVPSSYYFINGNLVTEYGSKNGYRMPPYHRLDISLNWTIKKTSKFETGLNFSIYNVYNRLNPYVLYYQTQITIYDNDFSMTNKGIQLSLFPIIPSISWNFKF